MPPRISYGVPQLGRTRPPQQQPSAGSWPQMYSGYSVNQYRNRLPNELVQKGRINPYLVNPSTPTTVQYGGGPGMVAPSQIQYPVSEFGGATLPPTPPSYGASLPNVDNDFAARYARNQLGGAGGSPGFGGPGDVPIVGVATDPGRGYTIPPSSSQNIEQDWVARMAANRSQIAPGVGGPASGNLNGNGPYGDWRDTAARYGIDPRRVVEVYMNPNDQFAARDPQTALVNAMQDDVWARVATKAFGRPPNEVEWSEHYWSKNVGSRDPLSGHPEAIQEIQREAEEFYRQQVADAQAMWRDYMGWSERVG